MLTFAIPNYRRPKELEVAVRSIAEQIKADGPGCRILICDHASDDDSPLVIEKLAREYDFIDTFNLPRVPGASYQHNFQYTFGHPSIKTEWVWWFGNDDILIPNALSFILKFLPDTKAEFIHVAEVFRAGPKMTAHGGKLLDLCCKFGWLDMTGFISCNLMKTARSRHAVATPSWDIYAHSAFVQSFALIEELRDAYAVFIDTPLVDSQSQVWTEEKDRMWVEHQIARRFFYVDEGLRNLVERGILARGLPLPFFRYHSYFLWDRLLNNMLSDYMTHPDRPHSELWKNVEGLAALLDDENRTALEARIREIKDCIRKHLVALGRIGKWSTILNLLSDGHSIEHFSMSYIGEPKPKPPIEKPPNNTDGLINVIWQAQKRQRQKDIETCNGMSNIEFGELAAMCANAIKNSRLADFSAQEEKAEIPVKVAV